MDMMKGFMERMNQGYASVAQDLSVDMHRKLDVAIAAAQRMRDADGLVKPFNLPPAVAFAIVTALSDIPAFDASIGKSLGERGHG